MIRKAINIKLILSVCIILSLQFLAFNNNSFGNEITYPFTGVFSNNLSNSNPDKLYNDGVDLLDLYELKESEVLMQEALEIFQSEKAFKKSGDCLINLGIIAEIEGDFGLALDYYTEALEYYEKVAYQPGIADSYNNIGIVYCINSQYDKGLEYYLKSLEIEEEAGNQAGISYSLGNIGLVYRKLGNNEKAIEYYLKSVEIKEKLKDNVGIAITYNNLGSVYQEIDSLVVALQYFTDALDLNVKLDNYEGQAYSNHNIGRLYLERSKYTLAIEYLEQALELRVRLEDKNGQASTLYAIAECNKHMLDYTNFLINLEKSKVIAEELKYHDVLLEVYHLYYSYFSDQNSSIIALEYLEKYLDVKEILDEEKHAEIVMEMQAKFDTEKKELEIKEKDSEIIGLEKDQEISELQIQRNILLQIFLVVLLVLVAIAAYAIYRRYQLRNQLNKILEDKNLELEEAIATKNKFFSIISHDLSNYASVLESVSGMISRKHELMDAEMLSNNLQTLNQSAIQNKNLIRSLLDWAIAQSRKIKLNPEKLSAKIILEDSKQALKDIAIKKSINLEVEVKQDLIIYCDKNTLHTVLRNLLSNAIKFSETNSTIFINVRMQNGFASISISDSGIGMTKEDAERLFKATTNPKSIGNSKNKGTGFGLILCKEFVEMNGGSIFVESDLGKGSVFTFTIPLSV